jgi:ubiquinone/menaquinone biosynthesis C-methylase UbiE
MRVSTTRPGLGHRLANWISRRAKLVHERIAPRLFLRGFAGFQVLVAAHRLGLFELLATGPARRLEYIRDELRLPDQSARALLLSCASLGLVKRDSGGGYRNSRAIERMFVGPRRAWTIPHLEAFHRLMYQPFYHLTEALQQGRNVGLAALPGSGNTLYERFESDAENKRVFYAWMKSIKRGSVPQDVVAALRDRRHLLDVGGGDGDNAIELARRLPELRITIVDLADTCELAARNVAAAGLSNRITMHPANFVEDPLPPGADAILFAHIFNIYAADTNRALVEKSAKALPEGGKLVVYNLISEDDETGPWYAGFMSLYFQVLATGTGLVYPPSRYKEWFAGAGFASLDINVTGEGVFIGTK